MHAEQSSIGVLERTRRGVMRFLEWLRNGLETPRERYVRLMRESEILLRENPEEYWRKVKEDARRHGDFELADKMRRRRGEDQPSAAA